MAAAQQTPVTLRSVAPYDDERGNLVLGSADVDDARITFRGAHNRLEVADGANLGRLHVVFDCDNGTVVIGPSKRSTALSVSVRVGQDSSVRFGRDVTSTEMVVVSATEGTSVTVGNDVMFASQNQLRADDGHPIFDVRSGRRVNVSRSIAIGNHVWLARNAVVLGGGGVGDGSVLGYGAVLTRTVPNNCVAAGVPARVVRRDIAWERPHLSLAEPYYKPDASTVRKSKYWRLTEQPPTSAVRIRRRIRRSRFGDLAVRVRTLVRRR